MSSFIKQKTFRSPKLLELARDQACVVCGRQDGTVVSAHSNLLEHGKGMGTKAHDGMVAWLCHRCHSALDQGSAMSGEDKRVLMLESICRTYMQLWDQSLIKVNR
jgi:hypothetical protein